MDSTPRRARMHAVLGDPTRLAIVDRLVLSDASPGELAGALGIGSNLLAHHLRVLAEAGLVRRVRSEGDARRAYVQLCSDDRLVSTLAGAGSPTPAIGPASRVVFVCTHNSARSQLATWVWREVSDLPATSAGTHPAQAVHPRAVAAARRRRLHPGAPRTSAVRDVVRPGDLVVAVCDSAYEELGTSRTEPDASDQRPAPSLHWAVPDPARIDTDQAFDAALEAVTSRVGRLAAALEPGGSGRGRAV